MIPPLRSALAASLSLAVGCSSANFEVPPVSNDAAGAVDSATANDALVVSEAATDAPLDARTDGAADASTFECHDPSACAGSKPICCASFELGNGMLPLCPLLAAVTRCQASCATQLPTKCPNSGRAQLCRTSADCTADPMNGHCCKLLGTAALDSVCVGDAMAANTMSCN